MDTGVTKWAKRLLDVMLEAGCVNATQISHFLNAIILDMQFKAEAQAKLREAENKDNTASESKHEGSGEGEAVSAPTLQMRNTATIVGPTLHTMEDSATHARKVPPPVTCACTYSCAHTVVMQIVVVATRMAKVLREMSPYLMQFQPYMQQHESIRTAVMAIKSALEGRSGRVFKSSRETVIRAVMELSVKDEASAPCED